MAGDELTFNDNQKTLLGLAAFTFFIFIIMIDDDDSMICCCTTILLLLAVPFAATNNINNTSTYAPIEPSSLFSNELSKDIKNSKKRKPANPKDMPFEWRQLKEIYPEAELDEYSDYYNFKDGNWDMMGLREDLDLMIKRTGKKPTENRPHKESDFKSMPNMALRKLLREKGLPTTGVKSKLIARLVDSVKEEQKIKEKSSANNNKKTEIKRKTVKKSTTKKVTKPKNEEKTTTIECPDCSATMEIPDISGVQEVECSECGIKGEIEL